MKPYKMKALNCALFSVAHIVCYIIYSWKICVVPEILFCIRYNKPVKVLLMVVNYGEILHAGVVSRQI